jgi:hypothetical protein
VCSVEYPITSHRVPFEDPEESIMQQQVDVCRALLHDARLNDNDKRLWMIMQHDLKYVPHCKVYEKTYLAARLRLSRTTIYGSLARLAAAGWYDPTLPKVKDKPRRKRTSFISVPGTLLLSPDLSARDVIAYCRLKETGKQERECSYKTVAHLLGLCVTTTRRALAALAKASWLIVNQKNQKTPVFVKLDTPFDQFAREQANLFTNRLKRPRLKGEAIVQSMVEVLVDSEYWVGGYPSYLRNPRTDELLQIDLYLPKYRIAIEFNGPQHYRPTVFASQEKVLLQKERDEAKARQLTAHGIILVVLTAADLSLKTIAAKLRELGVPLRDLSLYPTLVGYIENRAAAYRRKAGV